MDRERPKVLIMGLGLSGCAAAELALHEGAAVTALDEAETPAAADRVESLVNRGVDIRLGWNAERFDPPADLAVLSPGIAPDSLLGRVASRLACPVVSELEYGFAQSSCPILAVTGTNGKSTTVELVTHCLRALGRKAIAAGNIGFPLCEAARKHGDLDFLVVEVSSFQLEHIQRFTPLVAGILNLSPDHLDRYPSAEAYYRQKLRLLSNVKRADKIVLKHCLRDNPLVADVLPADGSRPLTFSTEDPSADFFLNDSGQLCRHVGNQVEPLLERRELRLRGRHNVQNVLAALAVCQAAGLAPGTAASAVKAFAPSPHRLELVTAHGGIRFINDSKATNPDAMCRAISAVADETSGKILLIAGGLDKGLDFAEAKPLVAAHVREALLIGKCRTQLATEWRDTVSCRMHGSLAGAVAASLELARSGDTVLLSPGCASQDMFDNYAERGNCFRELIKRSVGE